MCTLYLHLYTHTLSISHYICMCTQPIHLPQEIRYSNPDMYCRGADAHYSADTTNPHLIGKVP